MITAFNENQRKQFTLKRRAKYSHNNNSQQS